jgi:hypothetical protein
MPALVAEDRRTFTVPALVIDQFDQWPDLTDLMVAPAPVNRGGTICYCVQDPGSESPE